MEQKDQKVWSLSQGAKGGGDRVQFRGSEPCPGTVWDENREQTCIKILQICHRCIDMR